MNKKWVMFFGGAVVVVLVAAYVYVRSAKSPDVEVLQAQYTYDDSAAAGPHPSVKIYRGPNETYNVCFAMERNYPTYRVRLVRTAFQDNPELLVWETQIEKPANHILILRISPKLVEVGLPYRIEVYGSKPHDVVMRYTVRFRPVGAKEKDDNK